MIKLTNKLMGIFLVIVLVISIIPSTKAEEINLIYDANGNLIQDGDFYYEYDSFNQLKQIREKNSQGKVIARYTYDYLGNRVQKEIFNSHGRAKITYYPDSNFVKEMDEQGRIKDIVYYSLDSDLVARKENNQMFYYHPDHLGSTSVVTDERGRIIENNHYLPFGEILESVNERYLYTGQELDPESQLYYFGARYYSPYLAKFIQPDTVIQDPYNPQNLNRYSYALNNPYKYNDPSGNYFETVLDIGFVVWDVVDIAKNPLDADNWISLGLDLVSTATPVVAGLGRVYKAGKGLKNADKIIDVGRSVNKGSDAVKTADKVKDISRRVDKGVTNIQQTLPNFANPEKLTQHFNDHAADFGSKSELEYLQEAQKFLTEKPRKGVLEGFKKSGDLVRFNPQTDQFSVLSRDNIIKTYFKPDPSIHGMKSNLDYFKKNIKKKVGK